MLQLMHRVADMLGDDYDRLRKLPIEMFSEVDRVYGIGNGDETIAALTEYRSTA
jgi:hypothetical protein